jgi:hypothetical protein
VSPNSRITNEKSNHQAILPLLRFDLSVAEELTVEPVEFTELVADTVVPHVSDLSNVHERGMVRVPEKGVRVEPKVGPVVEAQ